MGGTVQQCTWQDGNAWHLAERCCKFGVLLLLVNLAGGASRKVDVAGNLAGIGRASGITAAILALPW
jgi:hypothetical protein